MTLRWRNLVDGVANVTGKGDKTRVGALRGQADAQNSGLFDQDRAKLAEALDAAE